MSVLSFQSISQEVKVGLKDQVYQMNDETTEQMK